MTCNRHTTNNWSWHSRNLHHYFFLTINRLSGSSLLFILFLLAGCSGPQSALNPAGPAAKEVAHLWWGMLIYSSLVVIGIVSLWLYAMRPKPQQFTSQHSLIICGGILLPSISIIVLLIFGIPVGHRMLPLPTQGELPLKIEVIGHQWWWEIHYPKEGIKLINELHLPIGRAIDMHVKSEDVIHSFWIPRINGKIDAIPGYTNIMRLKVTKLGYFRAQCAEFCGKFHAKMLLNVYAHHSQDFLAWIDSKQAGPTLKEPMLKTGKKNFNE
ncbi:cytochrome c oxidase subunit II [Legionella sp. CNM-1927-20]|uniref:cytochrome c oxidase subunit II n=1 Tax=Legionella sp. CNM-1927-20 TaxID=3422221 RepID=UPI00403ADEBC